METRGGYPQELKQIGAAALLLSSLKLTRIEETSAIENLKRKILGQSFPRKRHPRFSQIQERAKEEEAIFKINNIASRNLPGNHHVVMSENFIMRLINNYTPPIIPSVPGLNGLIGKCSKPFEKQLTVSDAREDQSRLSMNKADVKECLLPLLNEDEDPTKGVKVTTYDPRGNEFTMVFKIWVSKIHVLTGGWQAFFKRNNLKEHQDFVTLWMFRNTSTGRLCFVISWRRLPVFGPLKRRKGRKN